MKNIIIICGIIYGLAILPIYILYHIFIKIDVYTNMFYGLFAAHGFTP
jgi:hypothetical protein